MSYIPHTKDDIDTMLDTIGASDTAALFDEIPAGLLKNALPDLPPGLSEMMLQEEAAWLAAQNPVRRCFIGAGSYDHYIPAAVWSIASRGEFLTAYTPYQAEASQGSLQVMYEFQTRIAELTGMDVSNASLYDGATALAEAILMAVRIHDAKTRRRGAQTRRILLPQSLHPFYRDTVNTIVRHQGIVCETLPFNRSTGVTELSELEKYRDEDISALVIAQPNFFGHLEPIDALSTWASEKGILHIACVNPVALGLLKPPNTWGTDGVDIVCGEGQPLGCPMASGGPYVGFLSTRMDYVRQMPGRLVGRTRDSVGATGYTLTLQAREQHIRRAKATSNICTNQGLLVTAATVYMNLVGPEGFERIAQTCHRQMQKLTQGLAAISGVRQVFSSPYFHETLFQFDKPVAAVLAALKKANIDGGYPLIDHYPELGETLLVCTTEKRHARDIATYIETVQHVMGDDT